MNICYSLYEIDWTTTKEIVSIIGTISAIGIGLHGLSTWKRQLKGAHEYNLAKDILFKSYEVQLAIQDIRNPVFFLNQNEVNAGRHLEEYQRIYGERWQALNQKRISLQTNRLEAKAIWEKPAENCFNQLDKLIGELSGAIHFHLSILKNDFNKVQNTNIDAKKRGEIELIVWNTEPNNAFSVKINSAISEIEGYYKQHLKR